jgi:hypothetical protein
MYLYIQLQIRYLYSTEVYAVDLLLLINNLINNFGKINQIYTFTY